ncbi:hypothetical protein WM46_22365 [Citrobacter freundii complex sp. CFNIH2]|uniref:FKBP-type peptidyl-prolyl cis-trans isomerase n=1 Tax=Citrobacter freundii complex sp. CFNIH2 TaxID=2066049 RepID=UPI000CA3547D|nr:FKBP-type peptidyl-prolyl cis-trans isomerase [Citrobacter freundii complex sp. CFNIH2]AUO67237.1 hypothetical protein WM46_22365 [Citrobacter freundii complex sp. CFNIH2]
MSRFPVQNTVPFRQRLWACLRYNIVVPVLIGALSGQIVPAVAGEQPDSLPLQSATISEGGADTDNTKKADEMSTMVEALQKQIAAQQSLLQTLQARLAERSTPVQGNETDSKAGPSQVLAQPDSSASPGPPGAEVDVKAAPQSEPNADSTSTSTELPSDSEVTVPATDDTLAEPKSHNDSKRDIPPVSPSVAEPPVPVTGLSSTQADDSRAPVSTEKDSSVELTLSTDEQRRAYASGVSVWREIKGSIALQQSLGILLDERYVMAGLQDMALRRSLKMTQDEMDRTMAELNSDYTRRASDAREHQEAEGKAYRIAFSKEKGTYSDAGAWYRIEEKGKGRHLRTTDIAEIQVTGTLPDGTVFDGSGLRGEVRKVKVGALLPSVVIGLQKISPGGRLTVVVPPGKGYGDAGLPPTIPGGATLIFDITVKSVND